jgi:hypothetical protein
MPTDTHPFTPKDLLSLPRPSAGVPNPSGTLLAFASSTYSFETSTTARSLFVASLSPPHHSSISDRPKPPAPVEVLKRLAILPVPVWLDDETIAFLRPVGMNGLSDAKEKEGDKAFKKRELKVKNKVKKDRKVKMAEAFGLVVKDGVDDQGTDGDSISVTGSGKIDSEGRVLLPKEAMEEEAAIELWAIKIPVDDILQGRFDSRASFSYKLGSFPVPISDFKFLLTPESTGIFAFTAQVFADCDLWKVGENEEKFKKIDCGGEGKVYDGLFARQ